MFFINDEINFELLGVFKIDRTAQKRNSMNNRVYDSISIRLSGTGKFTCKNKSIALEKGDILYLPMNADYVQETSGESVIAIHFINFSYRNENKLEKITPSNSEEIEKIVLEMYNVWSEKKQGYKYYCSSLLYKLLYITNKYAHRETVGIKHTNSGIKKAINYIHANFRTEEISIANLAEMSFVSQTYFRKAFKKIYDISPKQYIINLQLEYASQLLQSHLYSIYEVSEKSGFNDVKYFSRVFKKIYGVSPSEYKNMDIKKRFK